VNPTSSIKMQMNDITRQLKVPLFTFFIELVPLTTPGYYV
jgi:hypothetical protein